METETATMIGLPLAEVPKPAEGPVKCPHHIKKEMEIYCKVCKEAICSTCTYTRHASCPAQFLSHALKANQGHQLPATDMSPFEAIEKTASDLSHEVTHKIAPESESREQKLREEINQVVSLNEELDQQLTRLIAELEADRDHIIHEATLRCKEHIESLKAAAEPKIQTLATKKAILTEGAEYLASHRKAIMTAIETMPVDDQAVTLVHACFTMMDSLRPIPKVEEAQQMSEKANLELYLPHGDRFLEDIRHRGWAGALEVEPKACVLSGPTIVAWPATTSVTFTLDTKSDATDDLCCPGGPLAAIAKVVMPGNQSLSEEVSATVSPLGQGQYEINMPIRESMAGLVVEVEVSIGGRRIPNMPAKLSVTKNSLGSTLFTSSTAESSIEALNTFLPPGRSTMKLLYRASRDGWESKDFHAACDSKGATVTIVKTTNGSIFGGYTAESWESSYQGTFKRDPHAFLFSLENNSGAGPQKIPLKKGGEAKAIFCFNGYGPAFGHSPDILITNKAHMDSEENSYSHLGSTYKVPQGQNGLTFLAGSHHFLLTEMEVYSL